jgi:hypothetical protein
MVYSSQDLFIFDINMSSFDDNLRLKIIAWFLQYPFYIFWVFIKIFFNKKPNDFDAIQAPQYPRTIVITGASQGLFSCMLTKFILYI